MFSFLCSAKAPNCACISAWEFQEGLHCSFVLTLKLTGLPWITFLLFSLLLQCRTFFRNKTLCSAVFSVNLIQTFSILVEFMISPHSNWSGCCALLNFSWNTCFDWVWKSHCFLYALSSLESKCDVATPCVLHHGHVGLYNLESSTTFVNFFQSKNDKS